MNPLNQITKIHQSGYKAVLAITGGGTGAINSLLEHGGGSAFLLEAIVPYGQESLAGFIGHVPEKYVSDLTARQLAMAAYIKAGKLTKEKVVGFGATCSLAKTDERENRKHVVYLAYQTRDTTCTFHTELDNTRELEEAEVSQLIIDFLGDAVTDTTNIEPTAKIVADAGLVNILHSPGCYIPKPLHRYPATKRFILSGSFNPLHDGHKEMVQTVLEIYDAHAAFELSITNVDKPPLDYVEIEQRSAQFDGNLVLTNAPLFIDKARLNPGVTFLVGIDTWERIIDPKYYSGSVSDRNKMIAELENLDIAFMVFSREINGAIKSLASPWGKNGGFAYSATEHRKYAHVSSTQLRQYEA